MSSTGLEVFDKTLQATNHWLKLMMLELATDDRCLAFQALRGVLHAVRDRIGPENAVHLGAQLPMLLRGAYYEGWHPAGTPTHERHLEDFVDHVAADLPRDAEVGPGEAAQAAFWAMAACLDAGEMTKLRHTLPHEALNLWPEELLAARSHRSQSVSLRGNCAFMQIELRMIKRREDRFGTRHLFGGAVRLDQKHVSLNGSRMRLFD